MEVRRSTWIACFRTIIYLSILESTRGVAARPERHGVGLILPVTCVYWKPLAFLNHSLHGYCSHIIPLWMAELFNIAKGQTEANLRSMKSASV